MTADDRAELTVTEALADYAARFPLRPEVEAAFGARPPSCPPAVWRMLVVAADLSVALAERTPGGAVGSGSPIGNYEFALWASAAHEEAAK